MKISAFEFRSSDAAAEKCLFRFEEIFRKNCCFLSAVLQTRALLFRGLQLLATVKKGIVQLSWTCSDISFTEKMPEKLNLKSEQHGFF